MSIISRITTWVTNQVLTSSALNGEFNNIVNTLNNLDAGTTPWDNVILASPSTNANSAATYSQVPLYSDWATYTPTITGCGTVSGVSFFWKQIDHTIYVRGIFTTGNVTGVAITCSLPNSTTINNTHTFNLMPLGIGVEIILNAGPTNNLYLQVFSDHSSTTTVFFSRQMGSSILNKMLGTDLADAAGDVVIADFSYPI
jgi:hypothetical protein